MFSGSTRYGLLNAYGAYQNVQASAVAASAEVYSRRSRRTQRNSKKTIAAARTSAKVNASHTESREMPVNRLTVWTSHGLSIRRANGLSTCAPVCTDIA
ncbi:hypothetical protein Amsp01_026610 [Amycolatopsis sp. NBRC 101858]|nr:hypothetical protein Amsp01_026610 [Amycolatopsis sp. NBRC 101858]